MFPPAESSCSWTYHSDVPEACMNGDPVIMGIDEAGRGPVLGPMVYGLAYIPAAQNKQLKDIGVDDSKVLTHETRCQLFHTIRQTSWVGWAVHCGGPQDISAGMLKGAKYNLNAQAHDTTIKLIKEAIANRVNVQEIFIDTVGPPGQYQVKLELIFPGIKIVVAKKADSLYPIVSAASICAKVTRDMVLENWVFEEPGLQDTVLRDFGSGYPGDPKTVCWLRENIDSVFAYPRLIRFSWMTCEKLMDEFCCKVAWHDQQSNNQDIRKFYGKKRMQSKTIKENDALIVNPAPTQPGREAWMQDLLGLKAALLL